MVGATARSARAGTPRTTVSVVIDADELAAIHRRVGRAAPLSVVSRFVRGALLMRLAFHEAEPLDPDRGALAPEVRP